MKRVKGKVDKHRYKGREGKKPHEPYFSGLLYLNPEPLHATAENKSLNAFAKKHNLGQS